MKRPAKYLLLLLLTAMGVTLVGAQEKDLTTLDILTSTVWRHDCATHGDNPGTELHFFFDEKTCRHTAYAQGLKVIDVTFRYYLSENKEETYKKRKEGKVRNGKYIVFQITNYDSNTAAGKLFDETANNPNAFGHYEIIGINPNEFSIPLPPDLVDKFVPCADIKTVEENLEKIRIETYGK